MFDRLFSPIALAGVTVPNRVVMAPMSSGLGRDDGSVTPELIAFLEARAAGGTGLIIVEFTCVDRRFGLSEVKQLSLDDDKNIEGHRRLVDAIKKQGAVACLQLHMPGRFAEPRTLGTSLPVSPSQCISGTANQVVSRALTDTEINEILERYVQAARRAMNAGYDAIELHGAHGYLPMAFLSPSSNSRDDKWGGDFSRRLQFPSELVAAVKTEIGSNVPLIYRLSSTEFVSGGLTIEDMEAVVPELVKAGADALHVTSGTMKGSFERMVDPMSLDEGWRLDHARRLKTVSTVPVIAIGPIRWPRSAEAALSRGDTDMIALGRPLLADPQWALKASRQLEADVIPCTNCNWCMERVRKHAPIGCAENPRTGRELASTIHFSSSQREPKPVLVAGAGPAGLNAALELDRAGVKTHLFESANVLGGTLIAASAAPGKDKLGWYLAYLKQRILNSSINLHLATELDAEQLERLGPLAVVIATGTSDVSMPIPTSPKSKVYSAYKVLSGEESPDYQSTLPTIVYGGGETGCEASEYLSARGLNVILVTRSDRKMLARSAEFAYRKLLRKRLEASSRISIVERQSISQINKTDVVLLDENGTKTVQPMAQVVLAQGRLKLDHLSGLLEDRHLPYVRIGDVKNIGRIGDAVEDAYLQVRSILELVRTQ
jgi:2,4-dienoyl-CoA reductase (NADPH2)